ncbi:MAG: hypothetical protein IK137_03210 [Bacilli bacterium]|nr:hypothetical protein [Bacilli bacterium]
MENVDGQKKKRWATVNISIDKLIDVCSNGRKTKEQLLKDFNIINDKNVHEVFRWRKFNDGFIDKITCYTDDERFIGDMCPSYREFLEKIFTALNVNPKLRYLLGKDDQELENVLKARIDMILNLADEAMLSREFPVLYRDLQDGRIARHDIDKRKEELENNTVITPIERQKQKEKLIKEGKHLHRCALSPAFVSQDKNHSFIHLQKELYTRFVERRKQYKKLIEKNNYNKYIAKNFDIDKIALYVVYGYLNIIDNIDDREKQLKYYNLVELYLNNPAVKKDVGIFVDGIDITYDLIYNRAQGIAKKLNRVDIKVEWELLPVGTGYKMSLDKDTTKRTIKTTDEELKALKKRERNLEVGREQTKFFMNTNYIAKAIGLKKFKGYFAYIYPNGIVILEKDFREKYPSTAEGAIYIMYARDFELLSGIGKTDLIYNPLLIAHNYHNGDWISKIKEHINKEGTEEEKEEVKKLIKRMQK